MVYTAACISDATYINFSGSTFIIPKGSENSIYLMCRSSGFSTPRRNEYAGESSPESNTVHSIPGFERTFPRLVFHLQPLSPRAS